MDVRKEYVVLNTYSTWRDVLRFAETRSDRDWKYIILGRPGPTGKTFLRNMLIEHSYDAVEVSENIWHLVNYKDSENHFEVDYLNKQLVIVLNRPLSINGMLF